VGRVCPRHGLRGRPLNSVVRCRVSLVTVARFFDVQSAELARIALEGSGVPVFLESEGLALLGGPSVAAIGGVRIQVPPSRVDDARAILKALAKDQGGELYEFREHHWSERHDT
jgi:Putative prokaryotic signal transducing protein